MGKRKKYKYYRSVFDSDPATCWYCKTLTFGCLESPNGDDCFCCQPCARKHGRIKKFRFKDSTGRVRIRTHQEKLEVDEIPLITTP